MLTRALAQNLAIIGMLATLQEVRRIGHVKCRCDHGYPGGCGCGEKTSDEADNAFRALGEFQWDQYEGPDESATHKEIYGR